MREEKGNQQQSEKAGSFWHGRLQIHVSKFCFDALLIRHQLHTPCTAALIYHDRPSSSISGAIQWHLQAGAGGGGAAALLEVTAAAAAAVRCCVSPSTNSVYNGTNCTSTSTVLASTTAVRTLVHTLTVTVTPE
jgi:hypothetical protein